MPIRARHQCFAPSCKSGFAGVDLLSATHERYNHGPICVPSQNIQEQGCFTLRMSKFSFSEIGIPCALCLIKHDDMLVRRFDTRQTVAKEADQGLNRTLNFLPCHTDTLPLVPCVSRQGLTHDMNQREIACQERCTGVGTEHSL